MEARGFNNTYKGVNQKTTKKASSFHPFDSTLF